jgi:hypothetical protein
LLTPLTRDRFVTGPGPEAGGPKPGRSQRCHTPEKSGDVAALSEPPAATCEAGATVCPQAGEAADANIINRNKSRR